MWNLLLTSNLGKYRMLRTIIQGILGIVIANCDYFISALDFSAGTKTVMVALIMAILSPIMKEMGTNNNLIDIDDEIDEDDDEGVEIKENNEE